MEINEFREKIKPGKKLIVEDKTLIVKEVIKFRFDSGGFYIKCFLDNGYVFADDDEENIFLLVKQVETSIRQHFPKILNYQGKKFKFLYTAHAKAEKILGEEIFKKGNSERFWDYKADDGSYLSLGINDTTKERLDFYGKIINTENVKIE